LTGAPDDRMAKLLRELPSIGELLEAAPVAMLVGEFGGGATKLELRRIVEDARHAIRSGRGPRSFPSEHLTAVAQSNRDEADVLAAALRANLVRLCRPEGRAAINATGILLHTGLGRSPLCREAVEALAGCGGYSILQTAIETGKRCPREEKIERMLVELTGCEAATVVNNNAAATMIVLNTLAEGREVILSRGQLVEIGGSFRMPEVMAKSGCVLREIGTTNRTHLRDYEEALGEATGAIMHVHTSNYRVRGFSGWPDVGELAALGKRRGVPVIDDLGSGALVPLDEFGLTNEPMVRDSIAAGSVMCCFSADKLICGPQSGVICGTRESIGRVRKNPFARMFRTSKLELAALEATLLHFVNGTYREALPFYRMLSRETDELEKQAATLLDKAGALPAEGATVEDELSYVGSGSAPDEGIPTKVVKIVPAEGVVERVARSLRRAVPSVFARISEDAIKFDMRTVPPEEVEPLARAVRSAFGP